MGIFDKIKHAIFGEAKAAEPVATSAPRTEPTQASASPSAAPSPAPPASPAQSKPTTVDIVPILDAAVKKNGQKLDWRHSIVDLMKAVGMDASLAERRGEESADRTGSGYQAEPQGAARWNDDAGCHVGGDAAGGA